MAGVSSSPTPWWQAPSSGYPLPKLQNAAPAGYQYDPVQMAYVPTVGSPSDALAQRKRTQDRESTVWGQSDMANAAAMGALSKLGGSIGSGGGSNGGYGSVGSPGLYGMPTGTSTPMQFPNASSFPAPNINTNAPQITAPPRVNAATGPSAQQTEAADAAAFARAKDQATQISQSAMRGLQGGLAGRGMGGAGYEAGQIGKIVTNAADQSGEASRQNAQRAYDLAQHLGDENLQAELTQRGQDIGVSDANVNADLTNRGQVNSAMLGLRGQDIGLSNAQMQAELAREEQQASSSATARGQDISLRGQDIQQNQFNASQSAQAAQADKDLQLKKLQLALSGLSRGY